MSDEAEAGAPLEKEPVAGLDAIISGAIEEHGLGEDTPAVAAEPTKDTDDRPRDASGKFVAKEPAEAKPSEPEPAKADAKAPVKAEAVAAETIKAEPAVEQPLEPHARWSDAEKAVFAALPRDAQQWALQREKDAEGIVTRKTQEVAETRKALEPVLGEFQRLNPLLQQMGMTPHQFVAESGAVATNLLSGNAQERAGAIAYLVQHRNIPVDAVLQALGISTSAVGENGQVTVDPTVSQLRQKVDTLESYLQRMSQQAAQGEYQRAEAEFNALGQIKDEGGQAKFPHFERVKQTMLQLVANNQAPTWDAAYSKAVRLDDDLYKETVEAAQIKVRADAERQRQEAVEKAKKAAPVRTSPGSPAGGSKLTGLDAHLNAAMERAGIN